MAVQILSLANGQLNLATTDMYASTAITTIVKSIRLVNTGSLPITINLYFLLNLGTARRIAPVNMTIPAGGLAIDDQEITMGPGDKVRGDASSGGTVDFVISGIQR